MSILDRLLRRKAPESAPVPLHVCGAIEIRRPWARRSANVEGLAGGYCLLTNRAATPDRLVAAACSVAEAVEIHAIKVVGNGIVMRPVEGGLALPPDTPMTLKPRGYHLLLRGVGMSLGKGARLPVTLTFASGASVTLDFEVEGPGPVGDETLLEKP